MSTTPLSLNSLDGSNGFVIRGIDENDNFGRSVSSAGDVNGDGINDIVIGAPNANNNRGAGYVVFGGSNLGSDGSLDLASLDGSNGFVLQGLNIDDVLGTSVSNGGDINGDNFDDFIVGGVENYVVFGSNDLGSNGSLDLSNLDGRNGFAIEIAVYSDGSVTNAGDINGDGFDDILIGAPNPAPLVGVPGITRNGNDTRGEAFVLFGGSGNIGRFGRLGLNTINAYGQITGLIVNSEANDTAAGSSVSSAGDINGDGVDDFIIGAKFAGNPASEPSLFTSTDVRGESYVIFGGSNLETQDTLNLSELTLENGFVIEGIDEGDNSGSLVSKAGDLNGDGFDDVIVVAPFADNSAEAYIVFGGNNIADSGSLELSNLDGTNGFGIDGVDFITFDKSIDGAGDFNSDGIDDLIISDRNSATSYLVFGQTDLGNGGSINVFDLDSHEGIVIQGIDGENLGTSVSNAGDINGDEIDDILIGAPGAVDNTGKTYVIFGVEESVSNEIQGTPENDTLNGTTANDSISGLAGDDSIQGLGGADTLVGRDGSDTIRGNKGNDVIEGNAGFDRLFGNNGDDVLVGGDGNDILRGNQGSDTLEGGIGNDTLFSGSGTDSFVLKAGEGSDLIADYFDGSDKFILGGDLEFNDLKIVQNINSTQIESTETGEILATLNTVTANFLNEDDFISES